VIVTTLAEELLSKLVDALVVDVGLVEANSWRIFIAALLVAALELAVRGTVFLNAILIAVAASIAASARGLSKKRLRGHGSLDDGGSHGVDGLLDGDLLVELLEVVLGGLVHEDALGGHERNFKGRDSVGDLDGLLDTRGLLVVGGVEVVSEKNTLHALITILASLTVALDVVLDVLELILEGVAALAVDLSIVDPEEGVDISNVGTDGAIVVVGEAAGTNGSGSGDVHVGRKDELVEDRAREAGLDVDDELAEELPVSHGVKSSLHLRTVEIAAIREAHGTLRTVIIEEDKDVVAGARLEGLAAADASHILTSKDLDEVLAVDKGYQYNP